jgi:hypothetical protein
MWGMKALYNTVAMNLNPLSTNTHEAVTMELFFVSVFYQHKHINNIKLNQPTCEFLEEIQSARAHTHTHTQDVM